MARWFKKQTLFVTAGILVISCGSKKPHKPAGAAPVVEAEQKEVAEADAGPAKPMNLTFVSPKSENILLIKNYVEIEIAITDPHPSTKWSLYYTKTKGDILSAMPIAEDLPVEQTKLTWDTSFIESGSYSMFATLRTDGADTIFINEQPFEISSSYVSNKAPLAQISYPAGEIVFAPGVTVPISYIIADSEKDPVTVKIEFSSDGIAWNLVADNIDSAENTIDWTLDAAAPRTARYRLRITANDGHSTTVSYNDGPFGVSAAPITFVANIKAVMDANCTSCHSGALPKGSFASSVFTSAAAPFGVTERKTSILSRTRTGAASPMPPTGTLSDDAKDLIQLWIWNKGL
jgi:cytochrome c5